MKDKAKEGRLGRNEVFESWRDDRGAKKGRNEHKGGDRNCESAVSMRWTTLQKDIFKWLAA